MTLGERHGTTLEPAVKDLWNPLEHTTTLFRWDLNVINKLSMDVLKSALCQSCELLELFDGADANDFFTVVGDPDRDRVTPESIPGEAPISCILKPVMEALFLNKGRYPSCSLIQLNKPTLDLSDLDKPAIETTIDERCLTSPAVGIAMLDCSIGKKTSSCLQVSDDILVGIFNVLSMVGLDHWEEFTVLIDWDWSLSWLDDAAVDAHLVIIFTKAGGTVDDTRTSVLGHKAGTEHLEASVGTPLLEETEEWLILLTNEGGSLELFKDCVALDLALLDNVGKTILHANVNFLSLLVLPANVVECRIDSQSQVTWKGPWRGRPSDKVRLLIIFEDWESDDDGGVRNFLVVGASLEVRQHGIASCGEGHDLGSSVD